MVRGRLGRGGIAIGYRGGLMCVVSKGVNLFPFFYSFLKIFKVSITPKIVSLKKIFAFL